MNHAETTDVPARMPFQVGLGGSGRTEFFFAMPQPGDMEHQPVMLDEVLDALRIRPGGRYIDGTYGRGGHTRAILQQLGSDGRLLIIDRDPYAIEAARRTFAGEPRVQIVHQRFGDLAITIRSNGWIGRVDGVFLDLGVSSPQLDEASRGFSFRADGPLDMRMDPSTGIGVATWLAQAAEEQIANVLWRFGEERYARRIARAIVQARQSQPLTRTVELAALIANAVPTRERQKDPATRSFQALRIFVNDELGELERGLAAALTALGPGGRLVVLSFHSLEDRIVKRFMRDQARGLQLPPGIPVTGRGSTGSALHLIAGAQKASAAEIAENPRSRSAVLRVAERLPA